MPQLVPVDHDPFAQAAPAQPAMVPVDSDPFAPPSGHSFDLMLSPEEKAAVEAQNRAILQAPKQPGGPGALGGVLATSGGMLEGIPVAGPAIRGGVNRAAAGIASMGNGASYNDNLKRVDELTAQAKEEHPYLDVGSQVAGGVLATVPMIAAAPQAFGAGSGSLLARTLMSGGTGMVLGGADAAVRSDFDPVATGIGTTAGAAFGLAGPAVGQLAGRGINMLAQGWANRRVPVPGMGNAAANMATEDFVNAGGRAAIDNRMGQLGPEAMLLDASPSHLGSAQGLGVRPETRQLITDPLEARRAGTNARLNADLDAAAGPAPVPSQVEAQFQAKRDALQPLYEREVSAARPLATGEAETLQRLAEGLALRQKGTGRSMLESAIDLVAPYQQGPTRTVRVPDTTPEGLHATRKAIDGMLAKVEESAQLQREGVGEKLMQLRQAVDDQLRAINPEIKNLDRAYETFSDASAAFRNGENALARDVHPFDVQQRMAAAPMEQQAAERLGMRARIDREVGNTANDLNALKQIVKGEGDWNRLKLAEYFGPEEADRIFNAVDREAAFANAYNKIVENSQTEMRRAASQRFSVRGEVPTSADSGLGIPLAGVIGGAPGVAAAVGAKGVARGVSTAATLMGAAEDVARNQQLARALILQGGPELDTVLNALGRRASVAGAGERAGQITDRLVNALMQSQGSRAGQQVPRLLGYQ